MYHPILKTNKKVLCVLYTKTKRKPNKLFPFFLNYGNHGTNAFIRNWFAEDGCYKIFKNKTKNFRHYFLPPPPLLPWPNRKESTYKYIHWHCSTVLCIKICPDATEVVGVSTIQSLLFCKTKPTLFFTAFLHDCQFASPHTFSLDRKKCFHR